MSYPFAGIMESEVYVKTPEVLGLLRKFRCQSQQDFFMLRKIPGDFQYKHSADP